jgi:hypothetical protein
MLYLCRKTPDGAYQEIAVLAEVTDASSLVQLGPDRVSFLPGLEPHAAISTPLHEEYSQLKDYKGPLKDHEPMPKRSDNPRMGGLIAHKPMAHIWYDDVFASELATKKPKVIDVRGLPLSDRAPAEAIRTIFGHLDTVPREGINKLCAELGIKNIKAELSVYGYIYILHRIYQEGFKG